MGLFTALDWLLTILIVLSATEAVTVMAIIAGEVAGTAWHSPLKHHHAQYADGRSRMSARCEVLACFLGQVFVGAVSPYLVILLVANATDSINGLAGTMLLIGGLVGGLMLGLALLAGLTSSGPVVRSTRRTDGARRPRLVLVPGQFSSPAGAA